MWRRQQPGARTAELEPGAVVTTAQVRSLKSVLNPRVLFRRVRTFRRLKVKLNRKASEDSPEQDMEASLTKVHSHWTQVTTTLLRKTKTKKTSWYPYPNLAAEGPSVCQRTSILGFPGKRTPSFTPRWLTQLVDLRGSRAHRRNRKKPTVV